MYALEEVWRALVEDQWALNEILTVHSPPNMILGTRPNDLCLSWWSTSSQARVLGQVKVVQEGMVLGWRFIYLCLFSCSLIICMILVSVWFFLLNYVFEQSFGQSYFDVLVPALISTLSSWLLKIVLYTSLFISLWWSLFVCWRGRFLSRWGVLLWGNFHSNGEFFIWQFPFF